MEKDHYIGLAVILLVIAIALYGGNKNYRNGTSTQVSQTSLEQTVQNANTETQNIQTEENNINDSVYHNIVTIQQVYHTGNASTEYITLKVANNATTTIPITGWHIHSNLTGTDVTIPGGTQLYFENSANSDDPIILYPGDTVYIDTGTSPVGSSFRVNECSGYLSQFQNYTPYLYTQCPAPRDEDLSSIPHTVQNNACFDYINNFPTCTIQTNNLPVNFSPECVNFIEQKINYSSCVDTHKSDSTFYQKEWRIFLKYGGPLWQNEREDIVLYDTHGKIVDEITY